MKKKTLIIAALAMLMMPGKLLAQNFNDYFVDKTLRVDYTFVGNAKQQMIAVDELNVMPRWYGKKQRLGEVPVEGNGQITVRAHKTGIATLSLPSSRNGFPTRRLRRIRRVSRMSSSYRCQKIRWTSPCRSSTTVVRLLRHSPIR